MEPKMDAELAEGAEMLRRIFPDEDERRLLERAVDWRPWRYLHGRWPTGMDIARQVAARIEEAAAAAAEKEAEADAA